MVDDKLTDRTPAEQAAHLQILNSGFGEIVTPTANQATAVSELSADELATLETTVADHIHSNGMHGYGTGAHLGGETHRENVATVIIKSRTPTEATASPQSYTSVHGGGGFGGGPSFGGGLPPRPKNG